MIYQFKISLRGFKPPIWRRIFVDADITFYEFHHILQVAFDWQNAHLHEFMVKEKGQTTYYEGISIGIPDPDDMWNSHDILDEHHIKIAKYFKNENDKCLYVYDFGEDWNHDIVLEKVLQDDESITLPYCVKAMRPAPPEDSRMYFDGGDPIDPKELAADINAGFENLEKFMDADNGFEFEDGEDFYDLFEQIKIYQSIKPWEILDDAQIIACRVEELNEWAYCSILGSGGQEFGLVAYIGEEGLKSLNALLSGDVDLDELMKSQEALFLSFLPRTELDPEDLQLILSSGVEFEDENRLPYLRDYESGMYPWPFDAEDAEIFCGILSKLNPLFTEESGMVQKAPYYDGENEITMLSVKVKSGSSDVLEVGPMEIDGTEDISYPLFVSELGLKRIQKRCRADSTVTIEFDSFYGPDPVQEEEDERPYFPHIVLGADSDTEMVIHVEVLPGEDYEDQLQTTFVEMLQKIGIIPGTVLVKRAEVFELIKPVCDKLPIHLDLVDELPVVADVKASFPGPEK